MKINNMQYPLTEKIGTPDLLVDRELEFQKFNKWIANIPKRLSKSWAILGRRKSGKTAFVQRLFNQIWSANGPVIPFYLSIPDAPIWYPHFALKYYRTFASHYNFSSV
jgi:GTPase SAR1 family protein